MSYPQGVDLLGCFTVRREHNLLLSDIFEARFLISSLLFEECNKFRNSVWLQELLLIPQQEGIRGSEKAKINGDCITGLCSSIRYESEQVHSLQVEAVGPGWPADQQAVDCYQLRQRRPQGTAVLLLAAQRKTSTGRTQLSKKALQRRAAAPALPKACAGSALTRGGAER